MTRRVTPLVVLVLAAIIAPGARADTIFTDAVVAATREFIAGNLRSAGYALVDIDLAVTRPDSFGADLAFTVTPGPRYRIETVSFAGVADELSAL